jgi:hypothetical protein
MDGWTGWDQGIVGGLEGGLHCIVPYSMQRTQHGSIPTSMDIFQG